MNSEEPTVPVDHCACAECIKLQGTQHILDIMQAAYTELIARGMVPKELRSVSAEEYAMAEKALSGVRPS